MGDSPPPCLVHQILEAFVAHKCLTQTIPHNIKTHDCLMDDVTHQLTVVGGQVVGVGVGEEKELGVGVDGEVGFDGGLVLADEVSHILDLDLRLGGGATEGVAAGVAGGSHGCKDKPFMN